LTCRSNLLFLELMSSWFEWN